MAAASLPPTLMVSEFPRPGPWCRYRTILEEEVMLMEFQATQQPLKKVFGCENSGAVVVKGPALLRRGMASLQEAMQREASDA